MQKIKSFLGQHRLGLWAVAVALLCAAVVLWAGYDLGQRIDDTPEYEILNDEYSRTVAIPGAGLSQTLPLDGGQRVYGMRLDFTTYDYAFSGGTLKAELRGEDGAALAAGTLPLLGLRDNTFTAVIFDAPYTATASGNYTLWLAYTPAEADAGHPLGLWCSEAQVGTMAMEDGSGALSATAAMQFVADYSGKTSGVLSRVLGVLLFAAVLGGFVLLFVCKAKLAVVFAVGALLLGGAFSVITPPLVAPDEYTHMAIAYRTAGTLLGQQTSSSQNDTLYLKARACDAPYLRSDSGDVGIYAYKEMLEGLSVTGQSRAYTATTAIAYPQGGSQPYLGQALGVALAQLLGLGFYGMLLLGRLGGLLLYVALGTWAVALAPQRLKGLFACVGLLPMAVQLGGGFSADGMVLGLVLLYTALCMRLRAQRTGAPSLVFLVLLAVLLAPMKAIYLPLIALCLLIPKENLDPRSAAQIAAAPTWQAAGRSVYPGTVVKLLVLALGALRWGMGNGGALLYATRDVDNVGLTRAALLALTLAALCLFLYHKARRTKRGKTIFWGVIAACCAVAVPVALYKLTHMWGGLTPEQLVGSIQANGDSVYTYSAGYICRNLPGTVKLLLRSVSEQGALWLQGVLGTALGEPIVYPVMVSWLLGVGLVLALLAAALPRNGEAPRLGRRARWGAALIMLAVIALSVVAALSWTPINYQTIFGLQGRYWLPVLPLALLLVGETPALRAQKPLHRQATFAVLVLDAFVLLQGYGIYATFAV